MYTNILIFSILKYVYKSLYVQSDAYIRRQRYFKLRDGADFRQFGGEHRVTVQDPCEGKWVG